jgi:hypothetical protein
MFNFYSQSIRKVLDLLHLDEYCNMNPDEVFYSLKIFSALIPIEM